MTTTRERVSVYCNQTVGVVQLFVFDCCACGVIFAITSDYKERRVEDGRNFCCPNGHEQSFGESLAARLQRKLESERRGAEYLRTSINGIRDQLQASERSKAAIKGHMSRIKNRINNGVCPVQECKRSFSNVKSHIKTQHPKWLHDHEGVL